MHAQDFARGLLQQFCRAVEKIKSHREEVVKKEILKWLVAKIIYPMSDSSWISLVQYVPKKGGVIVVVNGENKLIPTRTVTRWRV